MSLRCPLPWLFVILVLPGCLTVSVGEPNLLDVSGLGTAYVAADALPPWNGEILRLGIFGYSDRSGEILSLDVWPLLGVGIGFVGARVRLLPLEVGAGVLFYEPRPRHYRRKEKPDEPVTEEPESPEESEHDEGEPDRPRSELHY